MNSFICWFGITGRSFAPCSNCFCRIASAWLAWRPNRPLYGFWVQGFGRHEAYLELVTHPDIDLTRQIRMVRGQRVLLDFDLAALYGVATKRLNEQVRRNIDRFPSDFIFSLTDTEFESLRSQFATLKTGRGAPRKYAPLVFTEYGAIMAATILNSPTAVEMSLYVVRAFVKLRQALASNTELARRLETLERSVAALDAASRKEFVRVYKAILKLMGPAPPPQ